VKKIDMSSEAITRRRQTEQLRALSLSLIIAKKISDEKTQEKNKKDDRNEQK
jgi:hypothetical protein